MKDETKTSAEVKELDDLVPTGQPADAEAVAKLGIQPTIPRTLDRLIGLIGVNSSVVCPWPTFYFISVLNLANGGTAGLLVGTIVACILMAPVYISLAEKIRKYPTAGGQYHWVAALAPHNCRRFLSFFCCCILTFTWLSYLAAATFLFGMDITAIVLIHTGEYHVKYTFLAAVCVQILSCAVNITWGKHMNIPETLVVVVHIVDAGLMLTLEVAFLLLVSLLSFATATGTLEPNFTFTTYTGWSADFGVALSIVYVVAVLAGFDCASHIAEDTVDASKRIPRSLLWSTTANKLSCLVVAILIVLCAGDVIKLFSGPLGASGHPLGAIVQLTYNAARGNKALASAPFGLIAPILTMCCINNTAAASRMVFSFIRDDRNPFVQKVMARDLERQQVPRLTIVFTALSPMLILWINFLSAVGFQAIASQVLLSLSTTYMLAIGCSLHSRFYQPDLLGREWKGIFHLGTFWGKIVDIISLCFLLFVWVLSAFPYTTPVNATTLNYAPIIDAGVAVLGVLYYFTYARKHYQNPAPDEVGNYEA